MTISPTLAPLIERLAPLIERVKTLPTQDVTWIAGVRQLDDAHVACFWLEAENEGIISVEIATREDALAVLISNLMVEMAEAEDLDRYRPLNLAFLQGVDAAPLQWIARQIGCDVIDAPSEDALEELLAEIDDFRPIELQCYLDDEEVTRSAVKTLFAAAARFHQARLWEKISSNQPIAVGDVYCVLLGKEEVEPRALCIFLTARAAAVVMHSDDPEKVASQPMLVLTYRDAEEVSDELREEAESNRWKYAPHAYPLLRRSDDDEGCLASADEIRLAVDVMEALMLAPPGDAPVARKVTLPDRRIVSVVWPIEVPAAPRVESLFQFRLTLDGMDKAPWRRFTFPTVATLGDLHDIILEMVGWDALEQYAFTIDGHLYGDSEQLEEMPLQEQTLPVGSRFTYRYGKTWQFTVEVERMLVGKDADVGITCIDGADAFPPDESMTPQIYARHRDSLDDGKKAKRARAAFPDGFDPHAFDRDGEAEAVQERWAELAELFY